MRRHKLKNIRPRNLLAVTKPLALIANLNSELTLSWNLLSYALVITLLIIGYYIFALLHKSLISRQSSGRLHQSRVAHYCVYLRLLQQNCIAYDDPRGRF